VAPYSASKFFVRGLTEGLNIEYAEIGIKVIDVMPLMRFINSKIGTK
jgi:short-subunit dehydrogenase